MVAEGVAEPDKTILYITDSILDDAFAERCRELLLKNSCGLPIVSVSQKPLDFGRNVCLGDIGRSPRSLYTQVIEGLKVIDTKWVYVAEHDCLYCEEHFRWTPPDDNIFWYNDNVWFVQHKNPLHPQYDGMYSRTRRRRAQSQLICDAKLFLKSTQELLAILTDAAWYKRYVMGRVAEPGAADLKKAMHLARHKDVRHLQDQIRAYITGYTAKDFKTRDTNIDIRHEQNFTGQRRGNYRRFELPPWGKWEDAFSG